MPIWLQRLLETCFLWCRMPLWSMAHYRLGEKVTHGASGLFWIGSCTVIYTSFLLILRSLCAKPTQFLLLVAVICSRCSSTGFHCTSIYKWSHKCWLRWPPCLQRRASHCPDLKIMWTATKKNLTWSDLDINPNRAVWTQWPTLE